MSTRSHGGSSASSLSHAGDDLDVVEADPAEDRGAELLVAAAEQGALAADDADDQRRGLVPEQLEQLALAEVGADERAGAHGVDAEQRLRGRRGAPRSAWSSFPGRARRSGAGPSRRRRRGRRRRARPRRSAPERGLGGLHPQPVDAARGPRRRAASRSRPARAGLLVDVHDLAFAHRGAGAGREERRGDVARVLRAGREDAGVHLHAGRDAEHGSAVADDVVDVARRAVAAGEEDQVDAAREQLRSGGARVGGARRRPPDVPLQHDRVEAVRDGQIGAHLARRGQDPSARGSARAGRAPARRGSAATGVAPQPARLGATTPSVPLRPTRPPMPAIGLTIRPSETHESVPSLRSSAATSSTARRTVPTISSSSSSVITNGGANEIESDGRQRARDHAELEAAASDAGRDLPKRVELVARATGRRRTRARRSARSPGSRRRAGGRRTPPGNARA